MMTFPLIVDDRQAVPESTVRDLAVGEDGAAYSLSYVMVLPIYLLLVCLIIEAAITMNVKLGTRYAAYAAARSYAVWLPSNPGLAEQKAQQAAAQAMTAFATGPGGGGGMGSAYQEYAGGEAHTVSSAYVDRKQGAAAAATRVSLDQSPSNWNSDLTVTVHYNMPFRIPLIGRLLGYGGALPMQSSATIQVEGAKQKSLGDPNPLGIHYDPGEL